MSGCNKFTPNQCCGCVVKSHQLFPDFYSAETICFKRYRERISVNTLTTQLTRTWVSGVQSNNTVTLANTTDVTDETTNAVTADMRAGQFEWAFPQVVVPFGPFVVETETGEPGVNGTRTWAPRTQVTTNKTVWEEYRLIFRYDLSNQYNFGRDNAAGADIIQAATARLGGSPTPVITGFTGTNFNANAANLRHRFGVPSDMPTTPSEFDTLWADGLGNAGYSQGTVANFNILTRMPTVAIESFYLMWYSAAVRQGRDISGTGVITIWDRTPTVLPAEPYDWTRNWVREDFQTWSSRDSLPEDNYQISLETLLPATFWNTANRKLTVTFYKPADEPEDEEVLAEQEFAVSIVGSSNPYRWSISSDGHWGQIDHFTNTHHQSSFPIIGISPFGSAAGLGPVFKIRGSVWELTGGQRFEDGVTATYQFIPYWHGLLESLMPGGDELPPRSMKVRIKITSDNPQQRTYNETGLQHIDDGKKLLCPGNYTCGVIDDYAHPEWRVISHSLPGLNDERTPLKYNHSGCTTSGNTEPRQVLIEFDYTTYIWTIYFEATYEPSHRTVFFIRGIPYDGNVVNRANGFWPGITAQATAGAFTKFTYPALDNKFSGFCFRDVSVADACFNLGAPTTRHHQAVLYSQELRDVESVIVPQTPLTVPDKVFNSAVTGRAIHVGGNWETENSSHYALSVATRPAFTSSTVDGLPPYFTSPSLGIRIRQRLLVVSGLGVGLVFRCEELEGFDGATPLLNFVCTGQHFVPTLDELPSEADLAEFNDKVSSVAYWFIFEDSYYSINSGVLSAPEDELPEGLEFPEMVDVEITYTPSCYLNGDPSDYEVVYEDQMGFLVTGVGNSGNDIEGEPPLDDPPPTPEYDETIVDSFNGRSPTNPLVATIQTYNVGVFGFDTAEEIGSIDEELFDTTTASVTGNFIATPYTIEILHTLSVSRSSASFSAYFDQRFPPSSLTHVEFQKGPDWDYTWHFIDVQREGLHDFTKRRLSSLGLGGGVVPYGAAISLTMIKQVPRWRDRDLPTLEFDGNDALLSINLVTESVTPNEFWKVDRIEPQQMEFTEPLGILDNPPATDHVRIKITRQKIDCTSLSLTVGPSTYEPPEPL